MRARIPLPCCTTLIVPEYPGKTRLEISCPYIPGRASWEPYNPFHTQDAAAELNPRLIQAKAPSARTCISTRKPMTYGMEKA